MAHHQPAPSEKDKYDFENPRYIPDCEVVFEGSPDSMGRLDLCEKNHGHSTSVPVSEFTSSLDNLPPGYQSEEVMNAIKFQCDRTVKISVDYTSPRRPKKCLNDETDYMFAEHRGRKEIKRCSTGFIVHNYNSDSCKACPCHLCRSSDHPEREYQIVFVITATHTIFDDDEAHHAVCELFYDSKERDENKIKRLYGVKGKFSNDDKKNNFFHKCFLNDRFYMVCVTHEKDVIELVKPMRFFNPIYSYSGFPFDFMVCHPHGYCKHITRGNVLLCKLVLPPNCARNSFSITFKQGTKCRLTKNCKDSSYKLFQQLVKWDIACELGNEYSLKEEVRISIPLHQDINILPTRENNFVWMTVPPKTIVSSRGRQGSDCMPDMEFGMNVYGDVFRTLKAFRWFLVYDIKSCDGCSGAPVISNKPYFAQKCVSHQGTSRDGTKLGYSSFYGFVKTK